MFHKRQRVFFRRSTDEEIACRMRQTSSGWTCVSGRGYQFWPGWGEDGFERITEVISKEDQERWANEYNKASYAKKIEQLLIDKAPDADTVESIHNMLSFLL